MNALGIELVTPNAPEDGVLCESLQHGNTQVDDGPGQDFGLYCYYITVHAYYTLTTRTTMGIAN